MTQPMPRGKGSRDQRVVSPHHRRRLLVPAVLLAAGVAVFALLAMWVVAGRSMPVGGVDSDVHRWVLAHRGTSLVDVAAFVTTWGSSLVVLPLVFLGAVALSTGRARRRFARAVTMLGVLAAGQLLRVGASYLVARARPPAGDWAVPASGYAFPSGHTNNAALAATLLAWMITRRLHRRWARTLVWAVAVTAALAVGLTRIYLGVHWPSDVLGSWALSAAWLGAAHLMLRLSRSDEVSSDSPRAA